MGEKTELAIAVLNGAVGDYLARRRNGLATELCLVHEGEVLALERAALERALPSASGTVVVFVHGLMCTETIWDFADGSGDYGERLARARGVTPLRLRYNSGLSIPDSGHALDDWLTRLVQVYPAPIEELVLVGYSMGGLVVRAACHTARVGGHAWLERVQRCFYVGTPHRGAPLERAGRVLAKLLGSIDDPYTRLVAELANLRSSGVKDLGDADLRHEDRARRAPVLHLEDAAHPVPLLPELRHYLIAGSLSSEPRLASLFGDALVPVPSGTFAGQADLPLPPAHVKVFHGMSHLALAHHPDVYAALLAFWDGVAPAAGDEPAKVAP